MALIDELFVAIGVDATELKKGLISVNKQLQTVAKEAGSAAGIAANAAEGAGEKGKAAAQKMGEEFSQLPGIFSKVKVGLAGIGAALLSCFGLAKSFDTYIEQADGLNALSRKTGISAQELDAWGKANEAAGGKAAALFSSLEGYYKKTGRPATEFFNLGKRIEGMSERQAMRFLEARGVALDAIPVFLQGQKAANELVAKYRETAFTAEDAQNAANFKTAWMDFKIAAQSVGNILARTVVPVLTSALNALSKVVGVIRENIRFFGLFAIGTAAAFGYSFLGQIKKAIVAVRAFGVALHTSLLPVTLIAAGIAAVALALEDLVVFANGGNSVLGHLLEGAGIEVKGIQTAIQDLMQKAAELWETIKPFVGQVVTGILKTVVFLLSFIIGIIAAVIVAVNKLWKAIKTGWQWLKDAANGIASAFAKVGEIIAGIGKKIGSAFSGLVDIAAGIGKILAGVWDGFLAAAKGALDTVSRFFDSIGKTLSGVWSGFLAVGKAAIKNVAGLLAGLGNLVAGIQDAAAHLWDGLTEGLGAAINGALSVFEAFFSSVWDFCKSILLDPLKKTFSKIAGFLGFGSDDKDEGTGTRAAAGGSLVAPPVSAAPAVAAQRAESVARSANINTTATMNVTNNIQTRDNPAAIGAAVGGAVSPAFNRGANTLAQSQRGVWLKGRY